MREVKEAASGAGLARAGSTTEVDDDGQSGYPLSVGWMLAGLKGEVKH
jgi:hypothetical protein